MPFTVSLSDITGFFQRLAPASEAREWTLGSFQRLETTSETGALSQVTPSELRYRHRLFAQGRADSCHAAYAPVFRKTCISV